MESTTAASRPGPDTTRLDGRSLNVAAEKLDQLRQLLPEVFTEGRLDVAKLQLALGENVAPVEEHYGLNWTGKADCFREVQQQTTATLAPDREKSIAYDTAQNAFIEGENLEVLRVLQKAYFGKAKMIFIDPPYNTGKDSFVYPDDYTERKADYLKRANITDEAGFINKTNLLKVNSKESGQYHSAWLSMIYPRLLLARNLLRDDGAIFISIDDNEGYNLKLLMDEIFGAENYVATIVWQKKYAASNDSKGIAAMHDLILVYQKSPLFNRNLLPRTAKQDAMYKHDDGDGRGLWRADNLLVKSFSESYVFPIINPNTHKEYLPATGNCWRASRETIAKWLSENRIYFGKDGTGAPQLKRYLAEVQQGIVPTTWWNFEDAGHNDEANKELKTLFGGKAPFDTPKPTRLIRRMLEIATDADKGDLVLDFFGGSGTTAHAVMAQNAADNGNRKFIIVQLPELTPEGSEARRTGYQTISAISVERIRRVFAAVTERRPPAGHQQPPFGFKYLELRNSNFAVWNSHISDKAALLNQLSIFAEDKETGNPEAMVVELMLKLGLPLTTSYRVEQISGVAVYVIDQGPIMLALQAFTEEILQAAITLKCSLVITRDHNFTRDSQLSNARLALDEHRIAFQLI